jgi:hypothetical protein
MVAAGNVSRVGIAEILVRSGRPECGATAWSSPPMRAGSLQHWMQPDGSLNPTPTPPDAPNPSDSDASHWLARTIWALGEGYADFRGTDPSFAAFLK